MPGSHKGSYPLSPHPGVIIMDNDSFHHREDIQKAVTNAGYLIEYLPLTSIRLNTNGHNLKAIERTSSLTSIPSFAEHVLGLFLCRLAIATLKEAADACGHCQQNGKILLAGNSCSAADAQHYCRGVCQSFCF